MTRVRENETTKDGTTDKPTLRMPHHADLHAAPASIIRVTNSLSNHPLPTRLRRPRDSRGNCHKRLGGAADHRTNGSNGIGIVTVAIPSDGNINRLRLCQLTRGLADSVLVDIVGSESEGGCDGVLERIFSEEAKCNPRKR